MPGIPASAPIAAHPNTTRITDSDLTLAERANRPKAADVLREMGLTRLIALTTQELRADFMARLNGASAYVPSAHETPSSQLPTSAVVPSAVRRLFDAGYQAIIPIEPGGKRPAAGKDWTRYRATAERVNAWVANGNGTGLLTSAYPTIDSDIDDSGLSAEVWKDAVAPIVGNDAMRRVRSNAPRFAVPCRSDVPLRSVHCTFVDVAGAAAGALEVSGRDRQVVIAGRHHSGADLQWTDGARTGDVSLLAERSPSALPALSADIVEARLIPALEQIASGRGWTLRIKRDGDAAEHAAADPETLRAPSIEVLRDVVAHIPNDERYADRSKYLELLIAIRGAAGPENIEEGYEIAREWCDRWTGGAQDWAKVQNDYNSTEPRSLGWGYLESAAKSAGFQPPVIEFDATEPAPAVVEACATEPERLAALLGYTDPVLRFFMQRTDDVRTLFATVRAAVGKGDPLSPLVAFVFEKARNCSVFADKLDRFSAALRLALTGHAPWTHLSDADRRLLTLAAWLHVARADAVSGVNVTPSSFLDPNDSTEPTWIVPGIIEENGVSFVVGSSGIGKTALLAALGVSVARVPVLDDMGLPELETFFSRPVRHGTVVLFTGEDARGAMQRAKRYAAARGFALPEHFHIVPRVLPLVNADASISCWLQTEALLPADAPPVSLVIVDHLRDALGGEDENSASDVYPALQVAEGIGKIAKAAVVVAHHTGHEGTRERGSRVIRDKALATLLLTADNAGTVTGKLEKVKNAQDAKTGAAPLVFHLRDGVVTGGPARSSEAGTSEDEGELVGRLVAAISLTTEQAVSKEDLYAEMEAAAPAVFGSGVQMNTLKSRRRRAILKAAQARYIAIDKKGKMQRGPADLPGGVMPVGGTLPGGLSND